MRFDLNLNTVTLWAMWYPTVIYMQDWNGCSSLEQDNGSNGDRISITLTDKRDSNTYTVAKLKDGKCWMTQNLNIYDITLNPSDTDTNANFILPKPNQFSSIVWDYTDSFSQVFKNPSYDGAYYNFYTATAGQPTRVLQQISPYSICPRNWRLPAQSDFSNLIALYPNNKLLQSPPSFTLNGNLTTNGYETQPKVYGMYWSGQIDRSSIRSSYDLTISTNSAYTQDRVSAVGSNIRCIKK